MAALFLNPNGPQITVAQISDASDFSKALLRWTAEGMSAPSDFCKALLMLDWALDGPMAVIAAGQGGTAYLNADLPTGLGFQLPTDSPSNGGFWNDGGTVKVSIPA